MTKKKRNILNMIDYFLSQDYVTSEQVMVVLNKVYSFSDRRKGYCIKGKMCCYFVRYDDNNFKFFEYYYDMRAEYDTCLFSCYYENREVLKFIRYHEFEE